MYGMTAVPPTVLSVLAGLFSYGCAGVFLIPGSALTAVNTVCR